MARPRVALPGGGVPRAQPSAVVAPHHLVPDPGRGARRDRATGRAVDRQLVARDRRPPPQGAVVAGGDHRLLQDGHGPNRAMVPAEGQPGSSLLPAPAQDRAVLRGRDEALGALGHCRDRVARCPTNVPACQPGCHHARTRPSAVAVTMPFDVGARNVTMASSARRSAAARPCRRRGRGARREGRRRRRRSCRPTRCEPVAPTGPTLATTSGSRPDQLATSPSRARARRVTPPVTATTSPATAI